MHMSYTYTYSISMLEELLIGAFPLSSTGTLNAGRPGSYMYFLHTSIINARRSHAHRISFIRYTITILNPMIINNVLVIQPPMDIARTYAVKVITVVDM